MISLGLSYHGRAKQHKYIKVFDKYMLDIRNHSSIGTASLNEIDGAFFPLISPCRMYSISCQRRQDSTSISFLFFTSLNVNIV